MYSICTQIMLTEPIIDSNNNIKKCIICLHQKYSYKYADESSEKYYKTH
jgi:hypothetical protein